MDIMKWSHAKRYRAALSWVLALVAAKLLYEARAALLPFLIGSIMAYIMLPVVNWLDGWRCWWCTGSPFSALSAYSRL
jgi:predicted PurR-regulated permease PerM